MKNTQADTQKTESALQGSSRTEIAPSSDCLSQLLLGWFAAKDGKKQPQKVWCSGPLPKESTDCMSQLLSGWFAARAEDGNPVSFSPAAQTRPTTDCLSQLLQGWFEARKADTPERKPEPRTSSFDSLLSDYLTLCDGDGKCITSEWLKNWLSLPLLASKASGGIQKEADERAMLSDLNQCLAFFGLASEKNALRR